MADHFQYMYLLYCVSTAQRIDTQQYLKLRSSNRCINMENCFYFEQANDSLVCTHVPYVARERREKKQFDFEKMENHRYTVNSTAYHFIHILPTTYFVSLLSYRPRTACPIFAPRIYIIMNWLVSKENKNMQTIYIYIMIFGEF